MDYRMLECMYVCVCMYVCMVSLPAFMSLKDLSMFSELKYDRDMDMNWNFMSSSVWENIAVDRCQVDMVKIISSKVMYFMYICMYVRIHHVCHRDYNENLITTHKNVCINNSMG